MLIFALLYFVFSIELSLIPKTDKSMYHGCEEICNFLRATLLSTIVYTVILCVGEAIFYFSRDALICYLFSMGCLTQLIGQILGEQIALNN